VPIVAYYAALPADLIKNIAVIDSGQRRFESDDWLKT
jgi:hypothetical protein